MNTYDAPRRQGNIFFVPLMMITLIIVCFGSSRNVDGAPLKGDLNNDTFVNLVDAVLGLQVAAGEEPGDIVIKEADINNDGRIGLPESIHALTLIAGLVPEEYWAAEMFDDSGVSMGFLNFMLLQHPDGNVLAAGNYDVVVSMPPTVKNQPVQGDFSDQPMIIERNTLRSVYADTLLVSGISITFTLTITGTTDNGYATGQ